tara:strand:- start:172 stop:720 length:549 start_codon:yes stop_codon:yes gene_type:complete
MPAFDTFPTEANIIGRLLAGYGELEFALCQCIAQARDDFDTTVKALFRTRGERQRVKVADALGRSIFRSLGYGDMFSEAVADMLFCTKLRNRYAHCNWHDDLSGKIGFVDLEEIAEGHAKARISNLTIHHLDEQVLAAQMNYFDYVDKCLVFLNFEAQKLGGRLDSHPWQIPKKIGRPIERL